MAKARQVGALCWRKRRGRVEVLLVTSRETKRWVIPKGWPLPGLKDHTAARREAFEEAGVSGRMTRTPLGRFDYDKRSTRRNLPVNVVVFSLAVGTIHRNWPEQGERQRAWHRPAEAAKLVNEAGLKKLLLGFDA